jgi:hypothetical protein
MLLICGGLLGFLPILGLWMLPVGLLLLAEDVPPLKSARTCILDWVERRHPDWFASQRWPGMDMIGEDGRRGVTGGENYDRQVMLKRKFDRDKSPSA